MPSFANHRSLPGSFRAEFLGVTIGKPAATETVYFMLQIRPSLQIRARSREGPFLTRARFQEEHAATPDDLQKVLDFAKEHGLWIDKVDNKRRLIFVHAHARVIEVTFNVLLSLRKHQGKIYRVRAGDISIPGEMHGIITGVFGLDERPQAKPHIVSPRVSSRSLSRESGFDGVQLSTIYGFPAGDGTGQTVGIIELGGGFTQTDLLTFFSALGLSVPDITMVSIDGATNSPIVDPGADGEVALDIEVCGAVAPKAKFVVYFAPNTDSGFIQAVLTAIHDDQNKPSIISISWGSAESAWTQQSMEALNDAFNSAAAMGISVFVAAGDDGANDNQSDGKPHVDFPSSSPWVSGCGGTTLNVDSSGVRTETAWNDGDGSATGGGISDVFPCPAYQSNILMPANLSGGIAGRGVPDVSAVADPQTGYAVFVGGFWQVFGGTSAVAPLFSGLTARINQQRSLPTGLLNEAIYNSGASCFNDITSGNNSCDGVTGYACGLGWDPVTGWGSPQGNALLQVISAPGSSQAAA